MGSARWRKFLLLIPFLALNPLGARKAPARPAPRITAPRITTPKEALGFNLGDDYQVATYTQLEAYWKTLAAQSGRMRLVEIGRTSEGRAQYMAIVTSPENLRNLAKYQAISRTLAHAEIGAEQARELARDGKAIVWIDGGLHANETVGAQQLMETVYQLVSRTDPETIRLLNDDIVLCVQANPDGQEMVANWYMREKDPLKRSLANLPTLYNKYAGHDDNRDFYMSNLPETTNMNRQMFIEWFPQIVYDHHQTGPAGAVIFIPPFRDPFNYHLDPLIPLGVEMVGTAMHSRLVAEGKGGSAMRGGATYSTWWNGGLRTIAYFHNMIGILTEIIGNPTPVDIALVPEKQLPGGDWPLPVAPQKWRYRQSIDYELVNNYAVLDLASKYREEFLFNIWHMGKNSIEKGSADSWTVTPKRIAALKDAAPANAGGRGGAVPSVLFGAVLQDPKFRDPRGYVIPSDQPDFPTAVKFVNALLKNGIAVKRATAPFSLNGKNYPAGSLVVHTAQAFRPHILDMFEPQDHPNDFRYAGGPPTPPYDIAGWTLAMQMGVEFDRIFEGFDGPFAPVEMPAAPPPAAITGVGNPAGWLLDHRENDAFILMNRLLKAKCEVWWLKNSRAEDGQDMGAGAMWIPASPVARTILQAGARQLGVGAKGLPGRPTGGMMKIDPVRIGLYDRPGGLITSGWTRWLFEQFEFPFEVVNPQAIESGGLRSRFDVLVFTDGAVARAETVPQMRKFVESGGTLVAIGTATNIGELLGLPMKNAVAESVLPKDKFYIPGSLLRVRVDNTKPLAYGMSRTADVFFDHSPAFRPASGAVAWFEGPAPLESGWAWGQQYLDGAAAIVEASMGEGKVVLLGPEVAFRAQSHGTFKFLFNALYPGSSAPRNP